MRLYWQQLQRRLAFDFRISGVGLLLFCFSICFMWPDGGIDHPRVRYISKALKISTSKSNPPRLAFEEALELRKAPAVIVPLSVKPISLNEVIQKGQMRPAIQALYYRQIQLDPMVINALSRPVTSTQKLTQKLTDVMPQVRIPEKQFEPNFEARLPSSAELKYVEDDKWFEQLSPRQQRILEASGIQGADLEAPMVPSLAQSLASKVEEELKRLQDGGTVITPSTAILSGQTPAVAGVPVRTQEDSKETPARYHRVSGHLLLDAMSPLFPDHSIEVAWMREGQNRRTGRFDYKSSKFAIDVDHLSGSVKLEMFDKAGSLVASGGIRLSPELNAQALAQIQIKMRPVGQVASHYTDFYDQPTEMFKLDGRKVWAFGKKPIRAKASFDTQSTFEADPQGLLFIDGIAGGSSSFAMTESEDHYPALHMINAGQNDALPLIPKKTAQAMFDIIEDQQGFTSTQKNGAIVMGQVTSAGRAVAGVQVEIEGDPDSRPIYLNEIFIPDPQLKATSSSGYFVFAHLPQGFYSLRASRGSQFVGYGNVVNEANSAAFIEIEEPVRYAPFDIRVYDAFTGEPQKAEVAFQSLDQSLQIDGYGQIDHPISARYSLAEVIPATEAYLAATYPYAGDQEFAHLPMIPRAWMDQLIAQAKVNLTPSAGAILGFSEKGGYDISLPHLPEGARVDVIYFDVHGQQVPAAVDQGGFLLVNLPAGAQTVVLNSALGAVVSRVMNADAERLTIAKFAF